MDIFNNSPVTKIVFMDNKQPSYSDCATAQTYGYDTTPLGELDAGDSFCILTSAKRYARAVLTAEANPEEISFQVTVWEKE